MDNITETTDALNQRFADALLPWTITLGVFSVVGILGNVSVLLSFTVGWRNRSNTFRIFCISFAVIDLLTSALLFPSEITQHRHYFSFDSHALCKLKCLLNTWTGCAASLTLFIICIDRYKKICRPLSRQMSPKLAIKLCIALSFVTPFVLSVPAVVMCGTSVFNKPNVYNTTTIAYRCGTETKFERSLVRVIYKYALLLVFVAISLICIVMYCLIGRILIQQWRSSPGVSFKIKASFHHKDSLTSESVENTISSVAESTIHAVKIDNLGNAKGSIVKQQSMDKTDDRLPGSPFSPENDSNDKDVNVKDSAVENPLLKTSGGVPRVGSRHASLTKQNSVVGACLSSAIGLNKSPRRQSSTVSFTKSSRYMRRQSSGFGLSRFPYKTVIWFILTLLFISTYLMFLVMSTKVAKMYRVEPGIFVSNMVMYRFYYVNNVINAVIYYLFDENFRHAFSRIIPNLRKKWRRS